MTSASDAGAVTAGRASRQLELLIDGMTCASCAMRIEKKLNKLDGVTAAVNYATEQAEVSAPATVPAEDLVAVVGSAGYRARVREPRPRPVRATPPPDPLADRDSTAPLRQRLLVSLALTVPVVVLAMVPAWQFTCWQWLSLVLATPVVAYGGWPFHVAAWTNARHGAASMDSLISMGTIAAFGWSLYALCFGSAGELGMRHPFELTAGRSDGSSNIYLEVAAGVTTFVLAGRFFEARAKRRAGAALRALLSLGAHQVVLLRDGEEVRRPVEELVVGDDFLVRPGEKIATDGVVLRGSSAIDQSLLTGESVPVEVGPGDAVTGATLNAGGLLVVRATSVGAETQLAHLTRLVQHAQSGKAAVQRLADRISAVFVPVVIALATVTLAAWLSTGHGAGASFTAAVAVLIAACPCALGLATPTALLVGTGRGAQLGILIKGPEVLESTRAVDTVVLDKTGTVTTGRMSLADVVPAAGVDRGELLRLAGAVEAGSDHPIARAITEAAASVGPLPAVNDFVALGGVGVRGTVHETDRDHLVLVGRPRLFGAHPPELPADLVQTKEAAEAAGKTAVVVGWDDAVRGVLVVDDTVRPTSAAAVQQLRTLGLTPLLLTGDNVDVAQAVAREVGIEEVIAEVLPTDKVEVLQRLRARGRTVAMVGDGINDAAALAAADLGLAMGTGSQVAIEASDLTLVRGDLRAAADAIRLSRRTLATIKGNLFWAFAYNIAALPLAAAGLLNPMIAGAAMAFSSVFVVSNSLRLRRFAALAENQTPG